MQRYILIRCFQALIALIFVSIIVFALARISGDPLHLILPMEATQEDYDIKAKELGLDKPYPVQYAIFIANAFKGDFGESIKTRRPVTDMIMERLPNSLKLAVVAMAMAFVMAFPLGIMAALHRGKAIDMVARLIAVAGHALPPFWLGLIFIDLISLRLDLVPTSGMGGPEYYILPAFTLAVFAIAGLTRLLRSSMLEVLDSDYIDFARIKGVSERLIVWKHALRNALIPVVTYSGLLFAAMITHIVLIEVVFAWPGLGRLAYEAIVNRDYPLVQGTVLFGTAIVLLVNLVVDITYAYIDPRIRYT